MFSKTKSNFGKFCVVAFSYLRKRMDLSDFFFYGFIYQSMTLDKRFSFEHGRHDDDIETLTTSCRRIYDFLFQIVDETFLRY